MEFITIHHSKLKLESEIPRSALNSFAKKGWNKGPLPNRGNTKTIKEAK